MIEGFEQALVLLEQNGFPPGSPIFAVGHSLAGKYLVMYYVLENKCLFLLKLSVQSTTIFWNTNILVLDFT